MSTLSNIELALLTGHRSKGLPALVEQILDADFQSFFQSDRVSQYLKLLHLQPGALTNNQWVAENALDSLELLQGESKDVEDEEMRLLIGIASLHAFQQVNWTGPDSLSPPRTSCEHQTAKRSISRLAKDGEPAYPLMKSATLLYLAIRVFDLPFKSFPSSIWWKMRAGRTHREVLDEPVAYSTEDMTQLESFVDSHIPKTYEDLIGRYHLEKGLLHHLLGQDRQAATEFVNAANAMKLEYELTGIKGKRTKFQVNELTQLALLAQGRSRDEDSTPSTVPPSEDNLDHSLPKTLDLNDDTLLEKTEFTSNARAASSSLAQLDPNNQPSLHPLDQCVFLGLCLHVKNTSPQHGLTTEQMAPYVSRVISHPRNWSVHTMSLLLRSRLEANRTRTIERSTLQLQALIDQMPTADSSAEQRLAYLHQLAMPSKWELEKELAMRLMSMGVLKSALEILERLEMWEEVVQCWQAMEQPEREIDTSKEIVRGAIDQAREAKLWCLLGELEPEHAEAHFSKAWEVSGHKSGRAARSLGGYYFARGDYDGAIEHLSKAVVIRPLLARSWFILGCAYVRKERWVEARDAFARCVGLDEEDAESWNNLASVYLRLGSTGWQTEEDETSNQSTATTKDAQDQKFHHKVLAFRALQQGLKNSYSNWQMWENYMVVSVDVGELAEAVRALGRVVEERSETDGAGSVDIEILERLVSYGLGLYARLDELFTTIILPRISGDVRIWKARAQLLTWRKRWSDALDAYSAAYRCAVVSNTQLEVDVERWRDAVEEVQEYVDVLRNFGPKAAEEKRRLAEAGEGKPARGGSWAFQAKSVVRTFMGRTKENFEDEPEWSKLENLVEELKQSS
ncbi:Tetratricopeptide repeat protein 27 homolog Short=TPR repeat protein 27 homolog [Serendipita indica DSM 11827]|nr:Tetratricopeptide repeat protein 27 homolog Short=TPR repeat protein 27 homolog [Serendipita indica DSM 11827]